MAFLVSQFPCISETFILDQITGLIDRGCDVEIFADIPSSDAPIHPEVDPHRLTARVHLPNLPRNPAWRPFRAMGLAAAYLPRMGWRAGRSLNVLRYGWRAASLRLFFETVACAERPPFDLIHGHFGPNGLRGLALRNIGALSGKLITTFYGYDLSEFVQRRRSNPYRKLFANGDLTLAISETMRERLIALGSDPGRVIVHRLGVNPTLFSPSRRVAGDGKIRILTIGRMVPKKGLEYGLRSVAAVAAGAPGIEYTIIGDGPLRPHLERMTGELKLRQVVRFRGWQTRPEVVSALHQADILLAPSVTSENGDQEGTPVVILEAMAAGIPVVSTLHAGIPEIVENGVSGILVAERDVAALAGALTNLMGNPELRAGMGRHGRAAITERHDIDKLNDRLMEIYREAMTRRD